MAGGGVVEGSVYRFSVGLGIRVRFLRVSWLEGVHRIVLLQLWCSDLL